ncbi:MAG: thioredoxin domain-containing protein [Patescibacteria group bacterium]
MRVLKDNAPVIIIVALTVLSFVGILYLASKQEKTQEGQTEVKSEELLTEGTYVKGEASASATLVEFSDFQCPACKLFYPIIKSLEKKYEGKLRVAYKHYPLPQHQYAQKASEAAEAAGAQGKFFEYHDILFENQEKLTVEDLKSYARELGLNEERFNSDLDLGKYASKVKADVALGTKLGVDSTPTFYLNGKKMKLKSINDLENQILEILNSN